MQDVDIGPPRSLFRNFIVFSISFSLTHASVNCVLAYSSTLLGAQLASTASGVLYLVYSCSTVLLSGVMLQQLGPKLTVSFGLFALQLYVISFFLALLLPSAKWPVFISGAVAGGTGAGVLWVGQSMYYSGNTGAYSRAAGAADYDAVTSNFASYFAFFYLAFEVLLQIFALSVSALNVTGSLWRIAVFGTSSLFAVMGSVAINTVYEFEQKEVGDIPVSLTIGTHMSKLRASLLFIISSNRVMLFMPFQGCFGLSSGLINFYINRYVVDSTYGEGYVGLMMALGTISSALAVYPTAYMTNTFSKFHAVYFGCFIYFFNGILILCLSNSELAQWQYLIPLYVSQGVSRCIWEGVNKALVLEHFTSVLERERAFLALYFCSGVTAGLSFFCYHYINKFYFAVINASWAIFAAVCFYKFRGIVPGGNLEPLIHGETPFISDVSQRTPLITAD